MERPLFDIYIDLDDESTGLDSNSLVFNPAHEISFQTFNNKKRVTMANVKQIISDQFHSTQQFNDEQMVVTGIAISADTKIFRNDGDGDYDVRFSKKAIADIIHDYARKGKFNNVNIEHDPNNKAKGVYLIHSYQIDNERGLTAPERFKDANDGSWITSYKFENKELYNDVKEGKYRGFSVEGIFVLEESELSEEDLKEIKHSLDEVLKLIK